MEITVKKTLARAASIAVGVLLLGSLAPAAASAQQSTLEAEDAETSIDVTARWVDGDGYIRLPEHELREIAAVQTPDEIAAVLNSGEPYNSLYDPHTQVYLAAVPAEQVDGVITPFALSTGGCGGGNATSIRLSGGKGLTTCFSGTGALGISLPNTYYVSAGNQLTTWWGGGRAEFATAGASRTLTSYLNVDTVVRGS